MGKAYIGTSGFYYSHWMVDFYPKGIKRDRLLSFYQEHFPTVEINSSFYHIPRSSTIENWKKTVDENFIFTFKASKIITHLKKFNVDNTLLEKVLTPLAVCAQNPPKHLILFQAPANVKANNDRLIVLLAQLPNTFLYAFEFRHQTWFDDEVYTTLKKYNAALVLSDSPVKSSGERMWPLEDIETANFSYIRFHGSPRLYYSSYSDEDLKKYAKIIKRKQEKDMDIYCYFNNDAEGWAIANAKKLQELVSKK